MNGLPDDEADASLVRALIDGSQEAVAQLYDRHAGVVFSVALRSTRDRWLAADVVQETFLALWNRAELFDPGRGSLRSWLITIARNRSIDHARSAQRHDRAAVFSSIVGGEVGEQSTTDWLTAAGELIGSAAPEPEPETALATDESRAEVQDALNVLTPQERRVVALAYGGEMSQSEIAAHLGWPLGTVKTRTRRALRRLRAELERPGRAGQVVESAGVAGRRTPSPRPGASTDDDCAGWRAAMRRTGSAGAASPCV